MQQHYCFDSAQLKIVKATGVEAARLVGGHYRIAPREWLVMPWEVKTLRSLEPDEVTDKALAQTLCYGFKRAVGPSVLREGDLYRICLQDHRILRAAETTGAELRSLLRYVLIHELVHVARFGCRLQRVDMPPDQRSSEELLVDRTTENILMKHSGPTAAKVMAALRNGLDSSIKA